MHFPGRQRLITSTRYFSPHHATAFQLNSTCSPRLNALPWSPPIHNRQLWRLFLRVQTINFVPWKFLAWKNLLDKYTRTFLTMKTTKMFVWSLCVSCKLKIFLKAKLGTLLIIFIQPKSYFRIDGNAKTYGRQARYSKGKCWDDGERRRSRVRKSVQIVARQPSIRSVPPISCKSSTLLGTVASNSREIFTSKPGSERLEIRTSC